jgi:hypothetical protein
MADDLATPETELATTPETVESTPAPDPIPSKGFMDLARERGYQFGSESEALDALERLATTVNDVSPYAEFGKKAIGSWDKFQQWEKSQSQPAPAPQAPPKPGPWAPPKLDQMTLDTYFQRDSMGRYVPKENIPPEVRRQAEQWDAYTGQHMYNFRTDPLGHLKELGFYPKEEIMQEVKGFWETKQKEHAYEQAKLSAFDSLKPYIIDKNTGGLNAYGRRLTDVVTELEASGITDPHRVAFLGRQIVDSEIIMAQRQAQTADTQVRASAGMPQNPGGPAVANTPNRQPPAARSETDAPPNRSLFAMLKEQDPNFDFEAMRKELLS